MTTVEGRSIGTFGMLEREEALAALHEAHAEARTGGGRLVLVAGEAGVGKTTVVRAFCETVGTRTRVLVGACEPLSTPRPLGPFLDVIVDDDELTARARRGARPLQLFDSLRPWLAEQPTVLVLEDIHWGDEATLDTLRLLARRLGTMPLLILATYRDDGLTRSQPIQVLLGDLATEMAVTRLSLPPLSEDGVRSLALGHEIDAQALYRATGGNPFFVTQALATRGDELPATVRDAVLARCAGLDHAALDLLEVIASSPPLAEPWLLAGASIGAADRVDDCLSTGLVQSNEHGLSFRHEIGRLAVIDAMPATRRRDIHARILAVLTDRPDGTRDNARLAHHAELADDGDAVLIYAPRAAREAAAVGAYREAAAHYERALRFTGELGARERADLLEGRSRACYLADDQVEAIAVIREAIRCRQQQQAPLQEARALSELADYLRCRGIDAEAEAILQRAASLAANEPEQREHAYVLYAAGRFGLAGGLDDAIELSRQAIEIAERYGDEYVAAHARVTVATATGRKDPEAGLALLDDAAQFAEEHEQPEPAVRALNNKVIIALDWHRHDLVNEYVESCLARCAEHTSDLWRISALHASALSLLAQGRFDDASRRATAILDDPRESPWPQFDALNVLALVRARRGDPGARDAIAATAEVDLSPDDLDVLVQTATANAEIAWLENRPGAIEEATEAALQAARADGRVDAMCGLLFWRSLTGLEAEIPEGATGPHALALSGDWVQAAAEWSRRGQPYEAALALSQTGDVDALRHAHTELQRLGARPLAAMVARELRERGARDVPRGPRRSTATNAAQLTTRELDVLRLVAEGQRNRDIAAELVISRKTVDHHVSSILRKLGVDSRGKAIAEARRLGVLQDG